MISFGLCDFMWPGPGVTSLSGVRAHYGLEDQVWQAFVHAAGDCGDDPRPLAAIPVSVFRHCVTDALLPDTQRLTVMQASQLGMVYRAVHRLVHLQAGGLVANSMAGGACQHFEDTCSRREFRRFGEEAQVWSDLGPAGRRRISMRPGGLQRKVLWEVYPSHGGTSVGCGGPHTGTTLSAVKESERPQAGTLRGLWGVGAIPEEDLEIQQIHYLCDVGGRHFRFKAGARSVMLQPLGGVF